MVYKMNTISVCLLAFILAIVRSSDDEEPDMSGWSGSECELVDPDDTMLPSKPAAALTVTPYAQVRIQEIQEMGKLQTENTALKRILKEETDQTQQLSTKVSDLERDLAAAKREIAKLRKDKTGLETELKDTKEKCKNMCASALAQENVSLKKINKLMEVEVRDMKKNMGDMQYFVKSSEAMQNRAKELQEELNKRLELNKALTNERNQMMEESERSEKALDTERKEHKKQLEVAQDKVDAAEKRTRCPICRDSYLDREPTTLIPCGHIVCRPCIHENARVSGQNRCPTCRRHYTQLPRVFT